MSVLLHILRGRLQYQDAGRRHSDGRPRRRFGDDRRYSPIIFCAAVRNTLSQALHSDEEFEQLQHVV